eukprot:gene26769-4347_t
MQFLEEDNPVIGPIVIPCEGVSPGGYYYRSDSCTWEDNQGWLEEAKAVARQTIRPYLQLGHSPKAYAHQLGYTPEDYLHQIMILPDAPQLPCFWAGTSDQGCYFECTSMIHDVSGDTLGTITHELGHSLFLAHAAFNWREYLDTTSAMGSHCCEPAYKVANGYNKGINPNTEQFSDQLLVHSFNASDNSGGTYAISIMPNMEGAVPTGQVYTSGWSGISVVAHSLNHSVMTLSFCREPCGTAPTYYASRHADSQGVTPLPALVRLQPSSQSLVHLGLGKAAAPLPVNSAPRRWHGCSPLPVPSASRTWYGGSSPPSP